MGKKSAGKVRVKQVGGSSAAPAPSLMDDLLTNPADFIKDLPPPKQDPNTTMIWPMSQTFSLKYKNFSALYPAYMDKSRSIQKGGRRVAKDIAVEDPSIEEMSLILQSMNIRHVIQPFKCYPRDVGFIPRDDNATGVLAVTEEDDMNESPEEMGEIVYPPRARGRILVDMAQAEERLIYQQQQQQQQKLLSNIDVDIPDMEENMQSGNKKFSKRALLEEIARQISLLPLRDQRLHERKRRNKKLMTLTSTDNQKKKQDPGKKKKK